MNLVSNAVKFTLKGGSIQIKSKLIKNMNDFSFPKNLNCEQIYKNKANEILEVIVEDNGVGINPQDQ